MRPFKLFMSMMFFFLITVSANAISIDYDVGLLADQNIEAVMPGETVDAVCTHTYDVVYSITNLSALKQENKIEIYIDKQRAIRDNYRRRVDFGSINKISIQDSETSVSYVNNDTFLAYYGSSLDCVNKLITKHMSTLTV